MRGSSGRDDHSSRLALANLTEDFQILSSPKARGRPKQKSRAVKAKRNQAIAMVHNDLDMHERQMGLLTVYELLHGETTYKSTHEKLLQFNEFVLSNKPKAPIAHEIAKLPPHKTPYATRRGGANLPHAIHQQVHLQGHCVPSKKTGNVGNAAGAGGRWCWGVRKLYNSAYAKVAYSSKVHKEDQKSADLD
ncbi:unnamed protein product [Phytophthora fragariaefolia]|uniref:Unnamed protein product n=1 Tax=Phytophthora fragariaefolia TaxID=1490495 RepID=A0A9W7CRZ7_9STRA|nr:unnamed protein product [Phytophthora fragariaefolia]